MKNRFILAALIWMTSSCIPDDKFGLSPYNYILDYQLPGQTGSTEIDTVNYLVEVPFPDSTDISELVPSVFEISNLAAVSPGKEVAMDFNELVTYSVTAEDGSVAEYEVRLVTPNSVQPLEGGDFDVWYDQQAGLISYQEPGTDEATTWWATANRGLALGFAQPNTTPEDIGSGDLVAVLETVAAPAIVPIAAATLFTGTLTDDFPSVTEPRSNLDFGVPFAGRPSQLSFEYQYIPGAENRDENGNLLSVPDMMDAYIWLENRTGTDTLRVATGWFRSAAEVTGWTTENIELVYGPLPVSSPWYDYGQPTRGSWGTGAEDVTHICILFTSSYLGDYFSGAIGSQLKVNNVEVLY